MLEETPLSREVLLPPLPHGLIHKQPHLPRQGLLLGLLGLPEEVPVPLLAVGGGDVVQAGGGRWRAPHNLECSDRIRDHGDFSLVINVFKI